MSGRALLSYVTAERSPGRWGVMGSSQFSHIIQKYPGHIHGGVNCWVVVLKIPLLKIFRKVKWFLRNSIGPNHHFKMASYKCRYICPHTPSPWLWGWMGDCVGGSVWRLPRGPSIQRGSWNIRSRITRFWISSLASRCRLCPSDGSGPPGRTAGSLKNRLTEWF